MSKITLEMNGMDAVITMSDGKPRVISVLMQMLKQGAYIDPASAFGGLSGLLSLDTNKIYGSRIWMLYKDVCKEDLTTTIYLLRAVQLGFLNKDQLNIAINNYGQGIDVPILIAQVKEQLDY